MRVVSEEKLLRYIKRRTSAGLARDVANWLRRQPRTPRLVSRSYAAEMLGTNSPYISRLHDQGRMPDPVEVEGSAPVYVYEEVEALAKEFNAEREERLRRRAEREAAA
jgi:hypothetical protein